MGWAHGWRAPRACVGALALGLALALALAGCAGGSGTVSTAGGNAGGPGHGGGVGHGDHPGPPGGGGLAPARDIFTGGVVSATGTYSGDRGRVKVLVHPRGSGEIRSVRVMIVGHCRGSGRCINLSGTVNGSLAGLPRGLPDTGRQYGLSGSGRVSPLGSARMTGEIAGTGFISKGHLLMKLTLTSLSGRVTIVANSGLVNGFTSP